jgi:hypothetical protein
MAKLYDKSISNPPKWVFLDDDELDDRLYYESDYAIKYTKGFFKRLTSAEIASDIDPSAQQFENLDKETTYNLNSLGFRGPEYQQSDLVFAGCSYTFGLGIPEETIYGSLIASNYGYSYNNLSLPGKSVTWIVRNLFLYFKKYGNPKKLICLFPNFSRQQIVSDANILKGTDHEVDGPLWVTDIHHSDASLGYSTKPKYSKMPHSALDVLGPETGIYDSFQHIYMLEQYCLAANIELHWTSWDVGNNRMLSALQKEHNYFRNFVEFDLNSWTTEIETNSLGKEVACRDYYCTYEDGSNKKIKTNCHEDLLAKYEKWFYRGTDTKHGVSNAHKGVHFHAHLAEGFIKAIDKSSTV